MEKKKLPLHILRLRLKKYKYNLIKQKDLEIRVKYEKSKVGIKGMSYDAMSGGSGIGRTTENQALKIAAMEEKLNEFNKKYGLEIERIRNALSVLSAKEKQIIELKHFEDNNWETVVYLSQKCHKQCKRIEIDALIKLHEILN